MKENQYCLNTCLTVVLFITLAAAHIARVVAPAIVLPTLNLPNMVLVSVIALLADYYIFPRAPRCYICIPVLSIASFGILPLMAGFACEHNFWKFGLVGGIVFTVCTWLFSSVADRLSSGPSVKAAAFLSALGIYLAAQGFTGMIL
ncbi:MAG: hypothetical protein IJ955_03285 [Oscillospiraceae bacterium]|nr:hypothetical protein [Oscillospiraceae bacterium]